MQITASMVKELRERTGSGMMECKKALQETDGDLETAIENMRKSGLAKADKKSGRIAAEGRVAVELSSDAKTAAIVEVNCETDFVSGGDEFLSFVKSVAKTAVDNKPASVEELVALTIAEGDSSIEETRQAMVAKIGENIQVRRFEIIETESATFANYMHGIRIGVLVVLENGDEALGKDIAMHIAASNPTCVTESDVPQEMLEKEKEILKAQAAESGKPPEIIEKMLIGRVKKYLAGITLVGQAFVKDPDKTVGTLLSDANAIVTSFIRYEVGEGIEKKEDNFADEVMAQINAG